MQSHVINRKVDIYEYPVKDFENLIQQDTQLTIGDLHGNAIKFLFFLIRQKVLFMPEEDYADLVKIYNTREQNQKLRVLQKMSGLNLNESYNQVLRALENLNKFEAFVRNAQIEEPEPDFNDFLINLEVSIIALAFSKCENPELLKQINVDLEKLHTFLLRGAYYDDERDRVYRDMANFDEENKKGTWKRLIDNLHTFQNFRINLNESTNIIKEVIKSQLNRFNEIIEQAKVTETKPAVIRLIGDELSDRGSNDYFTLKIFEKLGKANIPVEIILSNHGIEFVRVYERDLEIFDDIVDDKICYKTIIGLEQDRSIQNLGRSIKCGLVSADDIKDIVENYYKPNLKLISYTIDESTNTMTLYTHALVGLETVADLASTFFVDYDDENIEELAKTIDEINKAFKIYVDNGAVFDVADLANSENNPIYRLLWARKDEFEINRPAEKNGYHLKYVHGHDGAGYVDDACKEYVINLDNQLGKAEGDIEWTEGNKGIYTILISQKTSPSLIQEPVKRNHFKP